MREEVVAHVVFDVARRADQDASLQEQEHAANDRDGEEQRTVFEQLRARGVPTQVVDRVAEHQRRGERDRARAHHTDETESERAAVAKDVVQETPKGRHHASITSTFVAVLSLPYDNAKPD